MPTETQTQTKPKLPHLHGGHRKRLIEKLEAQSLCDHEYLEAFLFNAIPRQNTNDLAHRLLAEFGTLENVFNASIEKLVAVDGVGESLASYIRCAGVFIARFWNREDGAYPSRFHYRQFLSFIKREYADLKEEVFDAYVLDEEGKIFGRKRCASGEGYLVEVQSRWLAGVICHYNPTGVILVHNHPNGDANPSDADNETTKYCNEICQQNGVLFCEHFIYSSQNIYSYDLNSILSEGTNGEK